MVSFGDLGLLETINARLRFQQGMDKYVELILLWSLLIREDRYFG